MNKGLIVLLLMIFQFPLVGQIINGQDTLYGNEWIDFERDYYKISLSEDGIYRIGVSELQNAGFPVTSIPGSRMQLYLFGEEIAIYTSTNGVFGNDDYLEFYGRMNRAELDHHLYEEGYDDLLNPEFSLYTDTTSYFLSWSDTDSEERYTEVENDLTNLPEKEQYYLASEKEVFSNFHFKPTYNGSDQIRFSHFDYGEGFGSDLVKTNRFTLNPSHASQEGPSPQLNFRMGVNSTNHLIEFKINGQVRNTYQFSGYRVEDYLEEFERDLLASSIEFELNGTISNSDRTTIAYAELVYAREFYFYDGNHSLKIDIAAFPDRRYIEVAGFDPDDGVPVVFDLTNEIRIEAEYDENSGLVKLVLPPSNIDREIIIIHGGSQTAMNASIAEYQFVDFTQNPESNYFIISNKELYNDPGSGMNWVDEYSQYRGSVEGGEYNVSVIEVQQIFDQFGYGINRHAMAMRNFAHFVNKNFPAQFLFIIGKGREYSRARTAEDFAEPGSVFYVPTFGVPGSDNLISSVKGKAAPNIPTGRLAAKDAEEVQIYLDKIKAHESQLMEGQTIEDQLWKKEILHLSGGDANIQQTLFNHLSNMASIIEENSFGANVTTFRKTSSDPIQTSTSELILNRINEGTSIITFFGHSAVGTFDFSLENPSEYDNYGKFPLIISLGCYSGNVHSEGVGLSESFVLEKDRGSIAFLASAGTAYITPQYNVGRDYYDFIGEEYYGESIGKILQEVIKKRDVTQSLAIKTLNQQLTLHGDPAVRLHPAPGPDYLVDSESVSTEPSIISSNQDSFKLSFDVVNLGRNQKDSIELSITHLLPNQSIGLVRKLKILAPPSRTMVETFLPVRGINYIGKNVILLEVDSEDSIQEEPAPQAEINNNLVSPGGEEGFCFYILDNSARPVSPGDFSIYTKEEVILKASTSNAYLEEQKYFFEIDTTETFNSPLNQQKEIYHTGGLIQWSPTINFETGEVYYWRVTPDSTSFNQGFTWVSSSFLYQPGGEEGWNQSHYYQYLTGNSEGIFVDTTRNFEYYPKETNIRIFNSIWDGVTTGYQVNFSTYSVSVRPWSYMDGGVGVSILDPVTGKHWVNGDGKYGSINSGNQGSLRSFGYDTKIPESRESLMNLIENVIPDGHYVTFFTVLRFEDSEIGSEGWGADSITLGKNLYSVIEDQGSTKIRALESLGSVPYNFMFVKGGDVLTEDLASNKYEQIISAMTVQFRETEGSFESILVGPAKEWKKIQWNQENIQPEDSVSLTVFGINPDGERIFLKELVDSENDISDIDANLFPHLILSYFSMDEIHRTVPKIQYWRVIYDEYPDAALDISDNYLFYADSIMQGDIFKAGMLVRNVSCASDMDSLLVRYSLIDENNQQIESLVNYPPLLKGDTLHLNFSRNTRDMQGRYQFSIELNPGSDQVEMNEFNNFGIREFVVLKDGKNPLLDVTFDGVHILDGDIVSSTPFVLIELKDENEFLLVEDVELFDLALIYPDGNSWNVPFNHESINFIPADQEDNRAQLQFTPTLDQDGDYTLVVQAKDVSDNFSGNNAYEINFRVILEQSISNILNYPNPFSTSTQFVFTLTGNTIPDNFKIQIMTLSGKVVKEITRDEIGPLRIGINRTEYKWDGTDDFGEKLANGVYLYRTVVKDQNLEELKIFKSSIDSYFKKGLGKLVILR